MKKQMKKVDVIIPVYKPDRKLIGIIKILEKQTYSVNNIILINTEQKFFDDFFADKNILKNHNNIIIKHISKDEFDHGRTRKMAVEMSDADYFICMTDDAVPVNDKLVENLLKPLIDGKASASYARQSVDSKCPDIERYTRKFNYPEQSLIKSAEDTARLGIKTYFCSNVCAAYDRIVYNELGGFIDHTIFNEDMIYAASVIKNGYSIAYCADAVVMHYHVYSDMQQLRRNFDLGVSQAEHPDIFTDVPSTSEGSKMVKETAMYFLKRGKLFTVFKLCVNSGFKLIGYKLGTNYKKLPMWLIRKITMNGVYWDKLDNEIN